MELLSQGAGKYILGGTEAEQGNGGLEWPLGM